MSLECADAVFTARKLLNKVDKKWFEEDWGREVSSGGIFEDVVIADEGRDEGHKLVFSWWSLDELRVAPILEPFSVGEWVLICIGVVLDGTVGM